MEEINRKYNYKSKKIIKQCLSIISKKYSMSKEEIIDDIIRGDVYIGRKAKGVKNPVIENVKNIDATSASMNKVDGEKTTQFSPMYLGPVVEKEIFGYGNEKAKIFENYWQYGKVFAGLGHIDKKGNPTEKWYKFREYGYNKDKGDRHPKGTKTDIVKYVDKNGKKWYKYLTASFGYYLGEKMDYITSRKKIYVPVYAYLVKKTKAFKNLKRNIDNGSNIQILDFDGPSDGSAKITVEYLKEKINDPTSPFGHGFVVAGLLAGIEPEEYIE